MDIVCYRCGNSIGENAAFCPTCGAPQIRVSPREELNPLSPSEPDTLGTTPPPPVIAQPVLIPGEIDWKRFLRMAWLPGVVAGLATAFYAPVGLLIVVPLTVVMTVRSYSKQHPLPLRSGQGAKLGMMVGLLSFVALAVLLCAILLIDGSQLREGMASAALQAASRNPDPHVQELLRSLVSTNQGLYLIIAMSLFFFFILQILFTALAGAVAATTFSKRRV